MKTLQEIKDQVARKYGYTHWRSSILDVNPTQAEKYLNEVAKEYAKQAIEEQLKIAAAELEENPYRAFFVGAAREVLNCTRIELD